MTLEKAIIHAEAVAKSKEREAKENRNHGGWAYDDEAKKCSACAAEHRQLAEWLKELRERRINVHWIDNADSYICPVCGFETGNPNRFDGCKCPVCGFQDEKDKRNGGNDEGGVETVSLIGHMESRLDTAISDVAYILDTLRAYRNIINSGDCNRCRKKKTCEYIPKLGQLVRYNCPFYKKAEDE